MEVFMMILFFLLSLFFSETTFAACESSYLSVELHLSRETYQKANTLTGEPVPFGNEDYVLIQGKSERLGIREEENQISFTEGFYTEDGAGNHRITAEGFHRNSQGKLLRQQPASIHWKFDHENSPTYGLLGLFRYTTTIGYVGRDLVDDKILRHKTYDISNLGSCDILDLVPKLKDYWS